MWPNVLSVVTLCLILYFLLRCPALREGPRSPEDRPPPSPCRPGCPPPPASFGDWSLWLPPLEKTGEPGTPLPPLATGFPSPQSSVLSGATSSGKVTKVGPELAFRTPSSQASALQGALAPEECRGGLKGPRKGLGPPGEGWGWRKSRWTQ